VSWVDAPSTLPAGTSTFPLRTAFSTSATVTCRAAIAHRIEHDAHRVRARAEQLDGGDAGHVLDPLAHERIGDLGEVEQILPLARQPHEQHRGPERVGLLDDGLVDLVGQALARPRDHAPHVVRRGFEVAPEIELDLDFRAPVLARRRDRPDALDPVELALELLRHVAFDDRGIGARPDRRHRHDRVVDLRRLAHWQLHEAEHAEEHDQERDDHREDGSLDEDVGEGHGDRSAVAPADSADASTATGAPGFSRASPSMITRSPTASPLTTSTSALVRSPVLIGRSSAVDLFLIAHGHVHGGPGVRRTIA
jgi:hypothetical protein